MTLSLQCILMFLAAGPFVATEQFLIAILNQLRRFIDRHLERASIGLPLRRRRFRLGSRRFVGRVMRRFRRRLARRRQNAGGAGQWTGIWSEVVDKTQVWVQTARSGPLRLLLLLLLFLLFFLSAALRRSLLLRLLDRLETLQNSSQKSVVYTTLAINALA